MKQAGYKSASGYLHELRLLHIEAGHSVPAALLQTFDQCKRLVSRSAGPPRKATELSDDQINWHIDSVARVISPLRSWVVAKRFLLSEIEPAHITAWAVALHEDLVRNAWRVLDGVYWQSNFSDAGHQPLFLSMLRKPELSPQQGHLCLLISPLLLASAALAFKASPRSKCDSVTSKTN